MYKIEKTVAVPAMAQMGPPRKYPFPEMEVGDSIYVVGQTLTGGSGYSARLYGKKSGRAFTVRVVEGGVRIWRIE